MNDTIEIKCPCCTTILLVERRTGKILEERRPILDQTTGDRYRDAMLKVKGRAAGAEEKFRQLQKERQNKEDKLDAMFKESLKRVKDSDEPIGPMNPFDME